MNGKERKGFRFFSFLLVLQVSMLLVYFSINIKAVGELGSGLGLIGAYFVLSFVMFVYLMRGNRLYIKSDVMVLVVLIGWLIFRITIDKQDTSYLKDQVFGTAGGMLFFLALGWSVSISLSELLKFIEKKPNYGLGILSMLIILICCFYIDIFYALQLRLRDDVFLLSDVNGAYQRPGNFSTITFILFTSFVFIINATHYYLYKNSVLRRYLINALYVSISIIAMLNAQMMGSNNSFLVIGGITFISLVIQGVVYNSKYGSIYGRQSNVSSLFFNAIFMKKMALMIILNFMGLFLLVEAILYFSEFDFAKTRFLGYGSGSNDSAVSRLDIIQNNFIVQFSDSPIFGNYNVDAETTGSGTYPHSALLFSLTHTGLIGFSLVIIFFYRLFRGILKVDNKLYFDRVSYIERPLSVLYFCIIIYVFLIANLATVLLWAVLWFSVGFLAFLIRFKSNESC